MSEKYKVRDHEKAHYMTCLGTRYKLAPSGVFSQNYNPESGEVETKYQLGFLPLLYYRVEF